MAEDEGYDFSDWQLSGDDEDALRGVVRGNLKALHEQIQQGCWELTHWNEDCDPLPPHKCAMVWLWGPYKEDPLLTLSPAQLAAAIIKEIWQQANFKSWRDGNDNPLGRPNETVGGPRAPKDELRDFWQRTTAGWRAALDAVDEEAKRLLDLPASE